MAAFRLAFHPELNGQKASVHLQAFPSEPRGACLPEIKSLANSSLQLFKQAEIMTLCYCFSTTKTFDVN